MKTTDRKEMRRFCGSTFVLALGLLAPLLTPGRSMAEPEQGGETIECRHRAEVFLGVAHEGSSDEFAAGIGYEYRISSLLGVGGFVEHAGEDEDAWTFGVPLFVHPYKGVRLLLAPGWEVKEVAVEEEATGAEQGTEHEQSFLLRAGVAYEFEVGRWSITPEFNVDFIDGGDQVVVCGLSLGYGF